MKTFLLFAGITLSMSATAHSPDDVNGPWYNSLMLPGSQSSCCGKADCAIVEDANIKIDEGEYWVRSPLTGRMLRVPSDKTDNRFDNPTGHYVACIHNEQVLCFILPPRT